MSEKQNHQWTIAEKLEVVRAYQQGCNVKDLQSLFHLSSYTMYKWIQSYEKNGITGLENVAHTRSRELSPKTQAAEQIVGELTKQEPQAGVGKTQGLLYRHGFLDLARDTVRKLLRRGGKEPLEGRSKRRNKPKAIRHFERARPNEMWQTDIMSFMIKGQYRVYVIGFLDDHSRFIVGWGLYRFQTAANVLEVFRAAIEKHGMPSEILSDNGRQYYTWRGKSQFSQLLQKLGIRHIRSQPYHPQTCGKIESFWRNLLQECLTQLPLSSFEEAESKIKEYVEYYNFKRPHQGIGNVMPSDRFYAVEGQVRQIVGDNTAKVEEATGRVPDYKPPTYIVGNIGGKELRVVAKDAEVSLRDKGEEKIELGGVNEATGGSRDGKAVEDKAAEPTGAVGVGPAGPDTGTNGGEALRAVGGVEGAVLPVAAAGPGGPAQGAGGQEAGQEARGAAAEPAGEPGAAGAPQANGAGGGQPAQGAGPLQADDGGGTAGDPPQRVEPGAQEEAR